MLEGVDGVVVDDVEYEVEFGVLWMEVVVLIVEDVVGVEWLYEFDVVFVVDVVDGCIEGFGELYCEGVDVVWGFVD